MHVTFVVGTVVVMVFFGGWYLVSARRRRENHNVVTAQWREEHQYPRDGDNPVDPRR